MRWSPDACQECQLPKKLGVLGVQLGWGAPGCFFLSCIAGSHAEEANKRQTENTRNRKRNSVLLRCLSTALYCLSLTLCLLKVRNDHRIQLLYCRAGNAGWIWSWEAINWWLAQQGIYISLHTYYPQFRSRFPNI